jgi:hypothetical protein
MAQYRVLRKSYIHDRLYEPGEVVEFDGPAGKWLEPVGAEKRPPKPSNITGQPGPDPGSPPPQSHGKSEFDEGGPTRATALKEYDEKRLADQEVDIPSSEPQVLARRSEAEGALRQDNDDKPVVDPDDPILGPPTDTILDKPATDEGPKRKSSKAPAEKPPEA